MFLRYSHLVFPPVYGVFCHAIYLFVSYIYFCFKSNRKGTIGNLELWVAMRIILQLLEVRLPLQVSMFACDNLMNKQYFYIIAHMHVRIHTCKNTKIRTHQRFHVGFLTHQKKLTHWLICYGDKVHEIWCFYCLWCKTRKLL